MSRMLARLSFVWSVSMACSALAVGPPSAITSRQTVSSTVDIKLDDSNLLRGTLVDRQGKPVVGAPIQLVAPHGDPVQPPVRSDSRGRFILNGLHSGVVTIQIGRTQCRLRLWEDHLAPPAARSEALLVVGASTVRGQQCDSEACAGCDVCYPVGRTGHFGGFFQRILQNPWIVGTGTAAAIAIPLAAGDDDAS